MQKSFARCPEAQTLKMQRNLQSKYIKINHQIKPEFQTDKQLSVSVLKLKSV